MFNHARPNRIFLAGVTTLTLLLSTLTVTAAESTPAAEDNRTTAVAESQTGSVTIPVSQTWDLGGADVSDLDGADTTLHYTIVQAEDSYNDGRESACPAAFDLTYDADAQDVTFAAEHAGVYTYTLTAERKESEGYTYDSTTYTIRQYVKNTGDGGLETFLTAENDEGRKVSHVVYNHVFTPEPVKPVEPGKHHKSHKSDGSTGSVTVPDTKAQETIHITAAKQWANVEGVEVPESVTFALVKDGVTTDVTQIVSEDNDWMVDFGLLPADGTEYSVTEIDVPENYSMAMESVITGSEVSYTITNTYVNPGENHQNQFTGDDSDMMRYAGIMGMSVVLLSGWFLMTRRRER